MTGIDIVNKLFERMFAIKPAYRQAWPDNESMQASKKEWVLAFKDEGIDSVEQLKKGIATLRTKPTPFIPSPGEFIQMCRFEPEDIGAPSVEMAYREACKYSSPTENKMKWSHPAVKHAWSSTGSWRLHQESRKATFSDFAKNYDFAINAFMKGELKEQLADDRHKTLTNALEKKKRDSIAKVCDNLEAKDHQSAMLSIKQMLGLKDS